MSKVTIGTKFMIFKKIWHVVFFCSYSKSRNNCIPEMFIFYIANSLVHIHWWSTQSVLASLLEHKHVSLTASWEHKHGPWREVLVVLPSPFLYLSFLQKNPGGRPTGFGPVLLSSCTAAAPIGRRLPGTPLPLPCPGPTFFLTSPHHPWKT